jgi:hypothetical protein
MDLQNAVNQALEREIDEELQFHISQSEASNHDSDEDDVAGFDTERANVTTQDPPPRSKSSCDRPQLRVANSTKQTIQQI